MDWSTTVATLALCVALAASRGTRDDLETRAATYTHGREKPRQQDAVPPWYGMTGGYGLKLTPGKEQGWKGLQHDPLESATRPAKSRANVSQQESIANQRRPAVKQRVQVPTRAQVPKNQASHEPNLRNAQIATRTRKPGQSSGTRRPSGYHESHNDNENSSPTPGSQDGMMMMETAKMTKGKRAKEDDDEEEKTLSQQIADGKYGLIQTELYQIPPKRPGILSYASNPEVPRDTASTLGGLDSEEIWLSENHVLVLRGGWFPDHNNLSESVWPPIDDYTAPTRQVKLPSNPKVPPPFPVQLKEGGPTQFIGPNGTRLPFYPPPQGGNGSFLPPPFQFSGNLGPGGGIHPLPGNGSLFPHPYLYPPPLRNASYYGPPPFPGNYPPPPGFFPPPVNGSFYPIPPPSGYFPPPQGFNGSFPPPGFPPFPPNLPPGAAFLPPPGNITDAFDEDDPSIYYPPPYDFFYPHDNSTEVPPGPLVPGIILPPPPNFFAPLVNTSDEDRRVRPATRRPPLRPTTTLSPVTTPLAPPRDSYLPVRRPSKQRPSPAYLPVTTSSRRKKPTRPTTTESPETDVSNEITAPSVKPVRPSYDAAPIHVELTHDGNPALHPPAYYIPELHNQIAPPTPNPSLSTRGHDKVKSVVVATETPVSYEVSPVTDILVTKKQPKQGNRTPPQTSRPNPTYYDAPQINRRPSTTAQEKPVYVLDYVTDPKQNVRPKSPFPSTTPVPLVAYYSPRPETQAPSVVPKPVYRAPVAVPQPRPSPPYTPVQAKPAPPKASYYFYEEPEISSNASPAPQVYNPPSSTPSPLQFYKLVSPSSQSLYEVLTRILGKGALPQNQPSIYGQVIPAGETGYVHNAARNRPLPQPPAPPGYVYNGADNRPLPQPPAPPGYVYNGADNRPLPQPPAPPGYVYNGPVQSPQYYYVNPVTDRYRPQVTSKPILQYEYDDVRPAGKPVYYSQSTALPPYRGVYTTPRPQEAYYDPQYDYNPVSTALPPTRLQSSPKTLYDYNPVSTALPPTRLQSSPKTVYDYNPVSTALPPTRLQSSPKTLYDYNPVSTALPPTRLQSSPKTLYDYNPVSTALPPTRLQSSPKTVYEYNFVRTTERPYQGAAFYTTPRPQYSIPDVTIASPTSNYDYEKPPRYQNPSTTPRPNYNGNDFSASDPQYNIKTIGKTSATTRPQYQSVKNLPSTGNAFPTSSPGYQAAKPTGSTVKTFPTPNPSHAFYTHQDESLIDDITKKYFTIFGQKIGEKTTPLPPPATRRITVDQLPEQTYRSDTEQETQSKSPPISLEGDLEVNYKGPLPDINPDSEYVTPVRTRLGTGALVTYELPGNAGGHVYFLTPQLVPQPREAYSAPQPSGRLRYRRKRQRNTR